MNIFEEWYTAIKNVIKSPDQIMAVPIKDEEAKNFYEALVEYLNENTDDISAYIGSDNKVNFMIKLNHEHKYQLIYEQIISTLDERGCCIGYPEEQTDIFQGFCKWLNKNHPNLESKIEDDLLIVSMKK